MSVMLRWVVPPEAEWTHQELGRYVDGVLPVVRAQVFQAVEDPAFVQTMQPLYRDMRPEVLVLDLGKFLATVKLTWNMRRTERTRTNGTAHKWKREISLSPPRIWEWATQRTAKEFEARLTDLLLHAVGHLLDGRYHDGWGHGKTWRLWARACGFVPIGTTSVSKKMALSVILHDRRIEEGIMFGVQSGPKGWSWKCAACGEESAPGLSRDKSRESYRIHRREVCSGTWVEGSEEKKTTKAQPAAPKTESPKVPKVPKIPKVPQNGEGSLFRVAALVNPKTGRTALLRVRVNGEVQGARYAHFPRAQEWVEVRASGWADATAKVRAGEGTAVRSS